MLTRAEIIAKAEEFSRTWKDATDEDSDAKSFWDELFLVFGTPRKNVASFEYKVKKKDGSTCFVDLLWKGKLIVEHKSKGKSLAAARKQAQEYILELKPADRPLWMIVCDFANFEVINLSDGTETTFALRELPKKIDALGFIGGFTPRLPTVSKPVNIKAVELLGDLYDALKDGGYPEHELAPLLVRILFALFAENTAIFEPDQFRNFISDESKTDGSDLGAKLDEFFEVLDTPVEKRQKALADHLQAFPYVNGALFQTRLPKAAMNQKMRDALLKASEFDWAVISPAIFGSLFQSVMKAEERRALGAHYTSEDDILKVLEPLFLNDLREELKTLLADKSTRRDARLDAFQAKLAQIKILDPACGCGNFLIVAYRELRRLETQVLVERYRATKSGFLDVSLFTKLNVDMMYGIEIEEFPAEIAKVGMWLMDHICNTELAAAFGKSFTRLPLTRIANIACANALKINWNAVLPPNKCSYVLGNPPFIGKKEQTDGQKGELRDAFGGEAVGNLDYVTAWYAIASEYIQGTTTRCAFVSTNSISQGEQVSELWKHLFKRKIKIDFAHRTFKWESEARGAAHVHVVIIGFSLDTTPTAHRMIYDHAHTGHVRAITANNINPYLVDAANVLVTSRRSPISANAPKMSYGSMMIDKARNAGDDEGLVFSEAEAKRIIAEEPAVTPYVKVIYGSDEYINGEKRYCLWAPTGAPAVLSGSKLLKDRINKVRIFRQSSDRPQTNRLASMPYRFGEIRQPARTYLLVPKVSSERRDYIPIGFVTPDIIASGSALVIDGASIYHFGILSSAMHNAWMRAVAGRLELRYQYSANVVYNNFVWPENPDATLISLVEKAAQDVLDARVRHKATLSNLYDPALMPPDLAK